MDYKEQFPLCSIHPGAKIGNNVRIDPFAVIEDNVEIGDNSWIASHVVIMSGARIGSNCRIFPGAVISAIPQDLKFKGEDTLVIIGDGCTIRECVTINRGTSDKLKTQIGNNCLIMAYCHVAHDCIIGNNCIFSNNTTLAGHIEIGDNVVLAGMVAVQQFTKIGSYAFIAGGSLVRKDVPPYIKAAREPLSYAGVNTVGLTRRGFTKSQINHIADIYRILFVHNYSISKAIELIKSELPESQDKEEIVSFITESKRGILKGFSTITNDDY